MSVAHQQRMRRHLAALFLALSYGLGACAWMGPGAEKPAEPPPPVVEPPPKKPPVAVPRPIRKPTPPGETPESAALPPEEPQPVDPNRVIGLTESDAVAWLGEPVERKDAASGTIWRYVTPNCEIEIYFYMDLQQRIMRALHYEVRGNDGEQRTDRCFQQLVSERHEGDGVANPPR